MERLDVEWIDACSSGNLLEIEQLVQRGYREWNVGLIHACRFGYMKVANRMIEYGANKFHWGFYQACICGHLEIAQLMIDKGNLSGSLLYDACIGGHPHIVQWIIDTGLDNNWNHGLAGACISNHYPMILLMIQKGANKTTNSTFSNVELQKKLLTDGITRSQLSKLSVTAASLYPKLDIWNSLVVEELSFVLPVRDLVPLCSQYVCL